MDNPRPSTSALSDTAIADELGLDEELSGFSSDSDEEVILPTLENLSDEDSDDSDEGNLGQGPSQSNRPSTDWCAYNGPDFVQYSYTNASGGYKPPSTNKPKMDESDIDDALDDDFSDRSLTDFSVSGSEYMPSDEESDVTSAEELNEEDGVVSDLDELELMEVDEEYQRVREESGDEEGNNIEN
ncbi:uncharacterized protein LOC124373632, partial [Homalodisca vitripennis]|uniref:uncharacterized protein LOC124373632 n=1 Tax=Homalodisca vitripennis TaxID=197043 RepID=UPI001EE9C588